MDKFRRIKTLEQAENICKFAFGKKVNLLTQSVEDMKADGIRVRVHKNNGYYCFTILNEFETDRDKETTEDWRFAMGVIYGNRYFEDLKSFMNDEYIAKPFNKVVSRVAFYRAKRSDEAE